MRPSNKFASEQGSASLEFITVGMVMLLPLVYLVLTMSAIQAGALAAEGAARQAARVFVQAETLEQANAAASGAVQFALDNHGVDSADAAVTITCVPDPADCLARKSFVTVQVTIAIDLPLAPPVLSGNFALQVPLDAAATQQVSQFAGSR